MGFSSFWRGVEGFFGAFLGDKLGPTSEHVRLLPGFHEFLKGSDTPRLLKVEGPDVAWMLEDILAMHLRLNTRVDQPALEVMARAIHSHCAMFSSIDRNTLGLLPTLAVMQRFHQEALKRGWQELVNRMGVKAVAWPETPGLAPSTSTEERAKRQAQALENRRRRFLEGPLMPHADLMLGNVPVWESAYPERDGSVWKETVLLAVGGALAVRHHEHILSVAEQFHAELEGLIEDELAKPLIELRFRCEAEKRQDTLARALALCQERVPGLVWARLLKEL